MIDFSDIDIEEISQECIPDKEFADFLRMHDAYDKFIYNFVRVGKDFNEYFNKFKYKKNLYLSSSFRWDVTPEGGKFWSHLSKLWSDVVGSFSDFS